MRYTYFYLPIEIVYVVLKALDLLPFLLLSSLTCLIMSHLGPANTVQQLS